MHIKKIFSVNFFLFYGSTKNITRNVFYWLRKIILNSRGEFSSLEKNLNLWNKSKLLGKGWILNSEYSRKTQHFRKVSTLEKILHSWENFQLLRKFPTLDENSQLLRNFSTFQKSLNSLENSQLLRKALSFKKSLNSLEKYELLRRVSTPEK